MNPRRRLVLAALASPVALAGCKVRTINDFPVTPADVRAVNVLLGAAAVDIAEGDNVVFAGLAFEASADYVEFDNEPKTFALRYAGEAINLDSVDVSLAGEQKYTLVAYGTTDFPRLLIAPDVTASQQGTVQVRLINGALGSPAYDLYITAPDVVIDSNVSPNFFGIQPGSSTTSLRFDKGTWRFRATPNGSQSILYDSGPVDLTLSNSVDILLYQLGSHELPTGMLLDVDGALRRQLLPSSIAGVRLINAAYQAGGIIGKYDGAAFTTETAYPGFTVYGFMPAGLHTVTVESVSAAGTALASIQYAFAAAHDHSVVAVGPAGAVQLIVLADNNRIPVAGQAKIRLANMVSDNGTYDVFLGDVKVVTALPPRTASAYVSVASSQYDVTFRDPATGAVSATLASTLFEDGSISTVYLTGVAGNLATLRSLER